MARHQVIRGLILDDDMEQGYLRILGTRRVTWVLTRETFMHLEHQNAMPLVGLMADALGPGLHRLPDDLTP